MSRELVFVKCKDCGKSITGRGRTGRCHSCANKIVMGDLIHRQMNSIKFIRYNDIVRMIRCRESNSRESYLCRSFLALRNKECCSSECELLKNEQKERIIS